MPIYITDLPHMKTMPKRTALPKGRPIGYGNLVFLYSTSMDMSQELIKNTTISNDRKYRFYYYNHHYRGHLNSRRYNLRDIPDRKAKYRQINMAKLGVTSHPLKTFTSTRYRNTYFDMSKYIEIFHSMSKKMPVVKRINEYWKFIGAVYSSPDVMGFEKRMVLVNAEYWTNFKGTIKSQIENPLFLLYYTAYRYPELIQDIDIDYMIYCNNYILKVNPSKLGRKDYMKLKQELNKLFSHASKPVTEIEIDEIAIDEEIQKDTIIEEVSQKYNFTGSNERDKVKELTNLKQLEKSEIISDAEKKIRDKVEKKVISATASTSKLLGDKKISTSNTVTNIVKEQVSAELENDKEMISEVFNYVSSKKPTQSTFSSKRDEELRNKQKEIIVNSTTIEELRKIDSSNVKVPEKNVSKAVTTTNENMKTVKFANFEKEYNNKVMHKDITNVFLGLNKKSLPMYVRDIKVEDTSDELNYKETYTVLLEDSNRQRHTVKVDVPKFLDDKFMYLGGNKKIILKQNFFYPVVKTGEDEVQIVTNYNKMFITRLGTKSLAPIDRLFKLIEKNEDLAKFFVFGDASLINLDHLSFIEYDELSKIFTLFKNDNTIIYLNQKEASDVAKKDKLNIPSGFIFVGYQDKKPIFMDVDTQLSKDGKHIYEYIVRGLPEDAIRKYASIKAGKRLMYNRVKLMEQYVPLITILCYWEGLSSVLKKANIKYRLAKKGEGSKIAINEAYVQFKDCILVYDGAISNALLLNGLNMIDCGKYKIADMNTAEPFVDYFAAVYGKIGIINALTNFYEFTIDSITEEILEAIHLPTDLVELMLYANKLLSDNSYTKENVQHISRVRSNEVVAAILNKVIAGSYIHYRNSGGKKKLSVPRDALLKQLVGLQTVEDYSTLNPIVELEKSRTISAKGFKGANLDRAYTIDKRSYDPTMIGVMAMSTRNDGSVGITRSLSMEPSITNVRGFVDVKNDKMDELKDVNLFSPAELLTTMGASHDDSVRTAMATTQSKHVIPVAKSSPVLITNGADQVARFNLSTDFVVNAKMDGVVVEKDDSTNLMVVQYKDGSHQAVDLSAKVVKNGGGGFYLSNQLVTDLKVGSKFKEDDSIAYHKDFFTNSKFNGATMNMGTLQKIAIMSSYNTYQDSCFITEKLSSDGAAEIVYQENGVIGKNSTIDFMKSIGDKVEVGDILVQYDTSFGESELNKFLSSLGDDLQTVINEQSKNSIKTKHSGVIEDIRIYASIDLEDMSPSLRKMVSKYYDRISNRKRLLEKYDKSGTIVKCGLLMNETTSKIEAKYGKIKGKDVGEGILIEYYIKHTDVLGVGDKLA